MDLPIEDVAELEQLCATYALKMTQGDIQYIIANLCTPDGTYSAFGETYGLDDWPSLVEAAPKGLFLTGTPVLDLDGDAGSGEVPLLFVDQTSHHMRMGWYTDTYRRTEGGWRLRTRTMTFLRRHGGADSGRPHDPRRPKPTSPRSG
ncbi:nuclear transport factor 2 family protein [Actinomadura sp. LOL_016]|uniref:nuclear transport factor 2 family protein n=1 Tax=unclassified Actinomadura TaxID=2626254 RepID=UPI003A80C561